MIEDLRMTIETVAATLPAAVNGFHSAFEDQSFINFALCLCGSVVNWPYRTSLIRARRLFSESRKCVIHSSWSGMRAIM